MPHLSFTWDERKSRQNQKKHGVSFDEAQSVFFDDQAREFFDPEYRLRVLLICHCLRRRGGVIRIISARKATPAESREYQAQAKP